MPKSANAPRDPTPLEVTAQSHAAVLGPEIRALRKSRGLSLQALAKATDRSIGNLSEIERGQSSVTIPVLGRIAAALGVDITFFFTGSVVADAAERDVIVRHEARRKIQFTSGGATEELLSPRLNAPIEMYMTTFKPGFGTGNVPRQRVADEAGLVLAGEIELHMDGKVHRIRAGDSFLLPAGGSHLSNNPGPEDAVIVWVASAPVGRRSQKTQKGQSK